MCQVATEFMPSPVCAGLSGENPKESEFRLLAPDRGRGGERGVARDVASGRSPTLFSRVPTISGIPRRPLSQPLPLSGARSMKNGDLVQTAESFNEKKGTESHGNKGLMPLSDFSPDSPASRGRGT